MKEKFKYEIRQVDAWTDPDGGWTYNETWRLGEMETTGDPRRAFPRWLAKKGIVFKHARTRIETPDGSLYEILDRKTLEPLFCAVPMF